MKSIERELNIKKKNIFSKKTLFTGVAVFSLLTLVSCGKPNQKEETGQTSKIENSCSEEYGYYSVKYIESLNNSNPKDFDEKFQELYNLEEYTINGKSYASKTIYITKQEDGSIHLVTSDDNYVDLLNNEQIESKRTGFCKFRSSSIFYELYEEGVIKDGNFTTEQLKDKITSWDGKKSTATPELQAEQDANEAYEKKYGR